MNILKEITPIWEEYESLFEVLQRKPRFHTYEEKPILFLGLHPSFNSKKMDIEGNWEYTLGNEKSNAPKNFHQCYDFAEAMGVDRSQWTYQELYYYRGKLPKNTSENFEWEQFLSKQKALTHQIIEQIQPLLIYVSDQEVSDFMGIGRQDGRADFCGYEFEFDETIGCYKIIGSQLWLYRGLYEQKIEEINLIGTYVMFSSHNEYSSIYDKKTKDWHLKLVWDKIKKVGKLEADALKKSLIMEKIAEKEAAESARKAEESQKMEIMNEIKSRVKIDSVRKIDKPLRLKNSIFIQKEMNNEVLNTLLDIESMLFEVNERSKLSNIATFTTKDLFFSLEKDSITDEDFRQMIDFFNEAGYFEDWQFQNMIERLDQIEYFKDYITVVTAANIEVVMKQLAFGGFEFENFDFRYKEDEQALDYIKHYGRLPTYEVTDIEQRNQCIESIYTNLMTDLNIDANTEIQQFLLNDALSDPSNSMFKIMFWVSENTIFVVKHDAIL